MNAQKPKNPLAPPPLGDRLTEGASCAEVAEAVAAIWLEITEALHPVIGHRGVAALYNRSLKLTTPAYPWLALAYQGALDSVDPAALKAIVAQQTAAEAIAGGSALFQSFHTLIASLVGSSLTDRLLRSVWDHSSGASSAQDITK
jgi:hypothetical protein